MKSKMAYFMILPSMIFFLLFSVAPFVLVFNLSFHETNYIVSKYIAFENYVTIFKDKTFLNSIKNSLLYTAIIVPSTAGLALAISFYVYNMPKRYQDWTRFIGFIPTFAAGVIISNVWRWIFRARSGLLNWLLSLVEIEPVMWLGCQAGGMFAVGTSIIYCGLGLNILLYLAALTAVPTELIDAAKIDGAKWPRIKCQIVLPIIMPTVLFTILLAAIGAMQIWETVFMLTNGNYGTQSIMFNIYETAFRSSRYGMASAKSIVLMLIILALGIAKKRFEKRRD